MSPGHSMVGNQEQRVVMLLERVRARKVTSLSDIPQPLWVGSALWPWDGSRPQSMGAGAPVPPKPAEPPACSPSTSWRKAGWPPAPCPGPAAGVEHGWAAPP